MPHVEGSVTIRQARLIFRNFAGKEGPYNKAGDRSFAVLLDPTQAEGMISQGWNVKFTRPRDDEEQGSPFLEVSIGYKVRPPKIVMVTSKGKTILEEEELELLDWAAIKYGDLIVNPYNWSVRGETGCKAYLKSLYAVIDEDELDLEYNNLDEIPSRGGRVEE